MRIGLVGLLAAMVFASGCGDYPYTEPATGGASTGGAGAAAGSGGGGAVAPTGGVGAASTGGGGATGDDSISPTIPGSTVLNTLTTEQATQLCDDTWAHFATAIPLETICKYKGLSFATSSSAPTEEQLIANCNEKTTSCDATNAWTANPGCSSISADCAATVAEYSACIRDTAAGFNETLAAMPVCDSFSSAATSLIWDFKGADRLPSCLLNNCSSLWAADPKNI